MVDAGSNCKQYWISIENKWNNGTFHDGVKHFNAFFLGRVCGSVLPSPLIIRSSNVSVTFLSDGTINGRGFQFKFSTIPATSKEGGCCRGYSLTGLVGRSAAGHKFCFLVVQALGAGVLRSCTRKAKSSL